jgi:SAM-dependent methyltransferase
MFLPLVVELKKRLPRLNYVALEPERPAFDKLVERIKGQNLTFVRPANKTFEAYLQTIEEQALFDFILFSQSFYFFPESEWDKTFDSIYSLLRPNGLAMIILDSREGRAYKMCDLITSGKANTLEFGRLLFAEDLERYLTGRTTDFKIHQFPVNIFIRDSEEKLAKFARILAFLYRTFPEKILKHKGAVEEFLEQCKSDNHYILENLVKVITFAKRS